MIIILSDGNQHEQTRFSGSKRGMWSSSASNAIDPAHLHLNHRMDPITSAKFSSSTCPFFAVVSFWPFLLAKHLSSSTCHPDNRRHSFPYYSRANILPTAQSYLFPSAQSGLGQPSNKQASKQAWRIRRWQYCIKGHRSIMSVRPVCYADSLRCCEVMVVWFSLSRACMNRPFPRPTEAST